MEFELDRQTATDLGIYQNGINRNSIFDLFDKAITIGGKEKFKSIFNNPLTDPKQIEERIGVFQHFQSIESSFKIDKPTCDFIEFYLIQPRKPRLFPKTLGVLQRVVFLFYKENEYYIIQQGIKNMLILIDSLQKFLSNNYFESLPTLLKRFHLTISGLLNDANFVVINQLINKEKITALDITRADYIFRNRQFENIKALLDIVYQLDVFTAVSKQGQVLGYSLPVISNGANKRLHLKGLFHPFIPRPISNDIYFDRDKNICFITGTNMAGKSTLLKSIGICVFLSQLGFPVPAAYMDTSTFKGLISTVNLSDDIHTGQSHFYSEVLRVKHVAQQLNHSPDLFVIFDELFRGTNVKDAYDASLLIISAFAKLRNAFFIISTHIVEVAHELADTANISFKYMETSFENEVPVFSHQLKDGITEERLGLWIVKNEGIVELINNAAAKFKNIIGLFRWTVIPITWQYHNTLIYREWWLKKNVLTVLA